MENDYKKINEEYRKEMALNQIKTNKEFDKVKLGNPEIFSKDYEDKIYRDFLTINKP